MTGQGARYTRFGLGTVLFLALWAVGLAQSTQSIRVDTYHGDIYTDIDRYRALREILGGVLLAGFHTDSADSRATIARRWRFQYAAMPTILAPIFTDESALRIARTRARRDGSFNLVYEYRRRPALAALERGLRRNAAAADCDLVSFDLAPRVVVYRLQDCADD
jgi:hypothetical protein